MCIRDSQWEDHADFRHEFKHHAWELDHHAAVQA